MKLNNRYIVVFSFVFLITGVVAQDFPWFMYTPEFRENVVGKGVKEIHQVMNQDDFGSTDTTILMRRNTRTFFLNPKGCIDLVHYNKIEMETYSDRRPGKDSANYKRLLLNEHRVDPEMKEVLLRKFIKVNPKGYVGYGGGYRFGSEAMSSQISIYAVDSDGTVFRDYRSFIRDPSNSVLVHYEYDLELALDYKENVVNGSHYLFFWGDFWNHLHSKSGFVPTNKGMERFHYEGQYEIPDESTEYPKYRDTSYFTSIFKLTSQKEDADIHTFLPLFTKDPSDIVYQMSDTNLVKEYELQLKEISKAYETKSIERKNCNYESVGYGVINDQKGDSTLVKNSQYLSFEIKTKNESIVYHYLDYAKCLDLAEFSFPFSSAVDGYGYDYNMRGRVQPNYYPQEELYKSRMTLYKTVTKTDAKKRIQSIKHYLFNESGEWELWGTEKLNSDGKVESMEIYSDIPFINRLIAKPGIKFMKAFLPDFKELSIYNQFGFAYYQDKGQYSFTYDNQQLLKKVESKEGKVIFSIEDDKLKCDESEYTLLYESSREKLSFGE